MNDALKAKVLQAVGEEPSPRRAQVRAWNAAILFTGFAAAVAVFLWWGGCRESGAPRSPALIAATFTGTLAIALGAIQLAWSRSGSMLGPSREALLGVVLAAPVAVFAWKELWSVQFAGATLWWPERVGYRCLGLSMMVGTAILSALLSTRRGSDPVHPNALGAALGVASGAAAAVLVDLWCPVGHPGHVALGHIVPMIALGLIGAGPGACVLDLKPARR